MDPNQLRDFFEWLLNSTSRPAVETTNRLFDTVQGLNDAPVRALLDDEGLPWSRTSPGLGRMFADQTARVTGLRRPLPLLELADRANAALDPALWLAQMMLYQNPQMMGQGPRAQV